MPKITPPKDLNREDKLKAFDRLLTIMDELRLNCPWDQKQTLESIRHLTIEEVYELSDAIIEGDNNEIKKELGDIMLHLVFYSRIASETNDFHIGDVLNSISEKMTYRHPHVYSNTDVQNEEDVKKNWEQLKKKEGNKTVLGGVPKTLPPMTKAVRIQSKARGAGFDWSKKEDVWAKVQEELEEFKTAPTKAEQEKEFGDVLFSLINYSRFIDIDPELALEKTNKKFTNRFNYIEQKAQEKGIDLENMSLEEMDKLWNEAKKDFR